MRVRRDRNKIRNLQAENENRFGSQNDRAKSLDSLELRRATPSGKPNIKLPHDKARNYLFFQKK